MTFSFFEPKQFLEVEFYSNKMNRTFRLLLQDKITKTKYDELKALPFYIHIRFTDQVLLNAQPVLSIDKIKLKIKKYAIARDEHEIVKFERLLKLHEIKYFKIDNHIKLIYREPETKNEFVFDFYDDCRGWNVISAFIENNQLSTNLSVRLLSNSARPADKMFDILKDAVKELELALEVSRDDIMKSYKTIF